MFKDLTIVIPAFNEERTIREVIKGCKQFSNDIIVVISKKSTDKTKSIAEEEKCLVIIDSGKGKGEAMRRSIEKVEKDIIIFIDADGSHIPKDIPKLVNPILEEKADMVIASRFLGGSEELHGDFDKSLRMFFSICIAQIINWRFKTAIMDTQNGFRAIKTQAVKDLNLKSKHTEIETEMVMKCFKKKYKILEAPSKELRRKFGKSNIKLSKDSWKYGWTVFKNLF